MIEVHVVESPNTILLQTEINKFLEDVDRANLIDIKFTSPQIDSVHSSCKISGYDNIRT